MGEKQEIGLLLNEVSSKEIPIEISISDSIETYTAILSKQSHKDILKWMKDKDLGNIIDNHTLLYHIVTKATNGDQIVLRILDDYVVPKLSDKIETYNYKLDKYENFETLRIDFSRLKSTPLQVSSNEAQKTLSRSCSVINDITLLPDEKQGEILLHPVIQSYIDLSWNKTRKWTWLSFSIYFIYVIAYCFFLRNIFYRPLHSEAIFGDIFSQTSIQEGLSTTVPDIQHRFDTSGKCQKIQEFCDEIKCEETLGNESPMFRTNSTFSTCGTDSKGNLTCTLEIFLAIMMAVLAISHMVKLVSLGPIKNWKDFRRVFNFENGVEMVVRVFGIASLIIQDNEKSLQYCSAIAIMFTFVELIYRLGRLPSDVEICGYRFQLPVGENSIMFYNMTKQIIKPLVNLFLLIQGTAFGLFILQKYSPHDHFENPDKSFVKTLIMALGEYDLNDLMEGDKMYITSVGKDFTMALVVLLAILGSLVMINLIVAIIILDIQELRLQVKLQDTINKAYHVISHNLILPIEQVNDTPFDLCNHRLCNDCTGIKITRNTEEELFKIIRKKSTSSS